MSSPLKPSKKQIGYGLRGFAMGMADIVPGVSGGTVAFITGIYDELVESISLVNKDFLNLLLHFKIKHALEHINFKFLLPLMCGVFSAIILMSRVMHFFLNEYSTQTWALFLGLIGASIIFVGKQIKSLTLPKNLSAVIAGSIIGYLLVSLLPVETSNDYLNIFLSGAIAICAMILPGISGSFILLILGKYAFVTGALKDPFADNHLLVITVFSVGCLIGILSFSKILNWLLKNYQNTMMCFLTGFMIGSLKKIWPWKKVLESKIIRGKTYVLQEANILPTQFDAGFWIAIFLVVIGFISVIMLEKLGQQK